MNRSSVYNLGIKRAEMSYCVMSERRVGVGGRDGERHACKRSHTQKRTGERIEKERWRENKM